MIKIDKITYKLPLLFIIRVRIENFFYDLTAYLNKKKDSKSKLKHRCR